MVRNRTVYPNDIYHGLPTFNSKSHSAIVCGANGISGQAMLKVLTASPDCWEKIYALSRGQWVEGGATGSNVRHLAVDFLAGAQEVGRVLLEHKVEADYAFFFSYKESVDQKQMEEENVALLKNFLEGAAMAEVKVKRIVLQTGGKQYGVHQGPYKVPAREDDPRVELGSNFYYRQEDLLAEMAPKYGFDYVIVRPMTIIGAVKGNFLNLAMTLGLYLAVTKELGDGPVFNGNLEKYHSADMLSSAAMNAYFEEYCTLTPSCANKAFNITNGDVSVWARLFPDVCDFFGLKPPTEEEQFSLPPLQPASGQFPTVRPLDYKEHETWELRNSWQQWSQEERIIEAWKRLAKREGLEEDAFFKASWVYADRNMALRYNKLESMSKVRRYGFHGYVDSTENLLEVLREAQDLKIIPKYT